ncbi:serine hydrolase [Candidatus Bipolaricaulota bacterium]
MRTGGISERIGRIARGATAAFLLVMLLASTLSLSVAAQVYTPVFTRDELIADARQLQAIIEDNHPDPYIHGGGKIAFHLRFQQVLASIPADGMTKAEFAGLLRPFVASIGDSHTRLSNAYTTNRYSPGGVPLELGVIEESLYVSGVLDQENERLIGSVLVAVEGFPLVELLARQLRLAASENRYHGLEMMRTQTLVYEPYLVELIPEWTDHSSIGVELRLLTGETEIVSFDLPQQARYASRDTQISLPGVQDVSGFRLEFIDPLETGDDMAYLRIDHTSGYREHAEIAVSLGAYVATVEQLQQVPSATEAFRDLVIEMRKKNTDTLVVDLRGGGGGNSLMSDILIYFLYGKDRLHDIMTEAGAAGGGILQRYSALFLEQLGALTLEEINEGRDVPLTLGDYDFSTYFEEDTNRFAELAEDPNANLYFLQPQYSNATTFYNEFTSGEYAGYHTPENVVVLVSPNTYSAGFVMMQQLDLAGATLVGTPSSQSPNFFDLATGWRLDNTGMEGSISHGWFFLSPNDPDRAKIWPVDVPLTYDYLASTGFDPNAELLLGLEWNEAQREAETLARFEEKLEFLREELKIPGISAAVVKDQELIWSQGFGYANLEDEIEATSRTPYGLASVTKPFAAFLLMKQVEDGRLDLDAPISDFGIDLGNETITVRHLLSHTSEDVPGSHYQYSGNRYSYLTSMIEQLYGDSFRNVLRQEILEPLAMCNTALNCSGCGLEYYLSTLSTDDPERAFEQVYQDAAIPYQYDPLYEVYPVPVPTYANAAAGLISTVNDLAKFAAAIERDELVGPETKELMFTPTVLNSGGNGPYGLGWFTEVYGDTELIWHYGYGAYSSLFLKVPDEDLTFIVLANTQNMSRPFGLGLEDVSVLASPFALAFFKEFVLQPRYNQTLPDIDWTAGTDVVVEQMNEITDPELRELYEGELWTYRKLYAGVGRSLETTQLWLAHSRAFPEFDRSDLDRYQVGRPGVRPPERNQILLSDEEAARWIGRFALRPEDLGIGLPQEIEIRTYDGRIVTVDPLSGCQELYVLTPVRLVTSTNADLFLIADEADDPFAELAVEYGGDTIAKYERVE